MTARNEYIHEDKPIEDVIELIIHIINGRRREIPAAILITWILFLLYDR